jgi:hypothetical protein
VHRSPSVARPRPPSAHCFLCVSACATATAVIKAEFGELSMLRQYLLNLLGRNPGPEEECDVS